MPKPKPKWDLHRHRIGQPCQHRLSGERRNPGNSAQELGSVWRWRWGRTMLEAANARG